MNDYKIKFKGGGAGFQAECLKDAHKIAQEYAEEKRYKMYQKTVTVKGWLYVGAGK